MAACANCYAYNDVVSRVEREVDVYGRARFLSDLRNRVENRPTRGRIGEALYIFRGSWLKDSDSKPDAVRLEMCRGLVPFPIYLARIAYDNTNFYTKDRKFHGGRTVAGGLATQPIEKYVQFDLDPFDDNTGAVASLLLLLHRLRAIAEKRLKQYASIWNGAIFGSCPSTTTGDFWREALSAFANWPRINGLGTRSWDAIRKAAEDAGFQDVGELVAATPRQDTLAWTRLVSLPVVSNYILCGGVNPPPFWPLELATQKSFWHLVLLEERTSEEVGNKIWGYVVDLWGTRGQNLPGAVLLLLHHKKRLYVPDLNKYLRIGLRNDPALLSGTGYDTAAIGGNLAVAETIVNNAGFLGTSTFVNRYAWLPAYDIDLENENRAKIIDGDVRRLLLDGRRATKFTVVTLPGWGPAAESWVGTPQTYITAPLPEPSSVSPVSAREPILLPPPSFGRKRKTATWKKLAIALSAGSAGLLGLHYAISKRRKRKGTS